MNYYGLCGALEAAGIADARFEAALLITRFCGVSAAQLPLLREKDFSSPGLERAVEQRLARRPLQYILGEWQFCSESYEVGEGCLIPRPETEQLVLVASTLLPHRACFLDLCCGSGCIAVSLLRKRPDCSAAAVDLSPEALDFTRRNAKKNGVSDRLETALADLLADDVISDGIFAGKLFDAVISNPPYIRSGELPELEPELAYEPRMALDGGEDGLVFYRAVIQKFTPLLKPEGFILLEAGYGQADDISKLAERQGLLCETRRDLSGIERTVLCRKGKNNEQ